MLNVIIFQQAKLIWYNKHAKKM